MTVKLRTVVIICLVMGAVVSRILLPEGPNYDGSNTGFMTYIGYLVEDLSLAIAAIVYLRLYLKRQVFSPMVLLWGGLFVIAIFASVYSASPITSIHLAVRGIAFIILGLLISEYIIRENYRERALRLFFYITFIIMSFIIFVEGVMTVSLEYVLEYGTGGSFVALIGLIVAYLLTSQLRLTKNGLLKITGLGKNVLLVMAILMSIFISLKMNSLTAILSFLVGYITITILSRETLKLVVISMAMIVAWMLAFPVFESGGMKIARKDIDTVREGTGRFSTWQFCWDKIATGNINSMGHGFMSDYDLFKNEKNLELTHSCHNSFLTTVVGMGYLGGAYYLLFAIFHLYTAFTARGSPAVRKLLILSYVSMLIFGIASPLFPGSPTILISISIVLYRTRNLKNDEYLDYRLRC